ncbi:ROK family protein [Streptomyces tubbatahanensis]|uniref:ROK family protein n=1 Tax=Streptomyces tubbatahanensis TaxID=2923272 RepID=A0ABY3Y1R5_9ACTN|nr:ROK family protein [Streptomyces tubbatahanensis]UNT00554.1 ROK family protein [Streptomyces tubbatahanensis]
MGADVGGTKIAVGLVAEDGTLLASAVRPTPAAQGPVAVLDAIAEAVRELPGYERASGLGVGTGGVVNRDDGTVVSANDLLPGWAGTRLGEELAARLGMPVAADNDANVFALAEQVHGAGAGCTTALYVSVGTGIGGGVVTGGRLLRGEHWTAGEFGHLAVPEAVGRPCNCGRTGHLEAIASGPAIAARFAERTGAAHPVDLRRVAALAEEAGEPREIGEAGDGARPVGGGQDGGGQDAAGAAVAREVLAQGAGALGRALAGLVNTLDPERVVIGGGVASIGAPFWRPLTDAFAAELLPGPSLLRPVPAALGPRAAVVGAAALLCEEPAGATGPGGAAHPRTPSSTKDAP